MKCLAYKTVVVAVLCFTNTTWAAELQCPDTTKLVQIGRELKSYTPKFSCPTYIHKAELDWLIAQGLPKIINKDFLGVEPPPSWQTSAQLLLSNCYKEQNICDKNTQHELAECVAGSLPFLFLQFGSWFADNCQKLNNSIVDQWPAKKQTVINLVNEFYVRVKEDHDENQNNGKELSTPTGK